MFADTTEENYFVHYCFSVYSLWTVHLLLCRLFTFLVSMLWLSFAVEITIYITG